MKKEKKIQCSRKVVIALKGSGNSGKTHALRKLYRDMIVGGATLLSSESLKTKNLRRYLLAYKRWRVVICEGGDTDDIIHKNFKFADSACLNTRVVDEMRHCGWDVIVMPAWIGKGLRNREYIHGCTGELLKTVWKEAYSLEIVDRKPVPRGLAEREKVRSQTECARRLKDRIDFVIEDRFMF